LVQEFQYPEELLQCHYDPQLTIRGLHYDVHKGLLIKVNSMLQIQSDVVFKGKRKLTEWEVSRVYPSRKLTLDKIEPDSSGHAEYVQLVDNFAKPVMCLLSDVIHWFVINNIDYEPESIYVDVRVSIAHFLISIRNFHKNFREIIHFRLALTRPIHCFIWQLAAIQKSSWSKIPFYVQCLIV